MMLALGAFFSVTISAAAAATYPGGSAANGGAVYTNNCSSCHGANLQGGSGPKLVGSSITSGYKTPAALYGFIKSQMPANAPGSLSAKQYADVTDFLAREEREPDGQHRRQNQHRDRARGTAEHGGVQSSPVWCERRHQRCDDERRRGERR